MYMESYGFLSEQYLFLSPNKIRGRNYYNVCLDRISNKVIHNCLFSILVLLQTSFY